MAAARLTAVLLLVSACSTVTTSDTEYALSEGIVDGPDHLTLAGAETIEIHNDGDYTHTLVVTNVSGEVMGATGLIESGEETTLEVNLQRGTYVFSCRIVAQDDAGNLIDHYQTGMHRTVTIQG